jgi:hypothetical protein
VHPQTSAPPRTPPDPSTSRALNLGRGLRPIIFGGAGSAPNLFGGAAPDAAPQLVLSVHSRTSRLLGYCVVDRIAAGGAFGGLTIASDLGLPDVVRLARVTALQLRLLELRSASHHCLELVEEKSDAATRSTCHDDYLDALRPLVGARLCAITHTLDRGKLEPRMAREGLSASAAAATLAALAHVGVAAERATVALHRPDDAACASAKLIAQQGPRIVEGDLPLAADADVVLAGAPLAPLERADAGAIQARVIVALGTTSLPASLERHLHEREIVFVPDVLARAGIPLALDLRSRGLDERSAVARTFTTIDERARVLLARAAAAGAPLSALVVD